MSQWLQNKKELTALLLSGFSGLQNLPSINFENFAGKWVIRESDVN